MSIEVAHSMPQLIWIPRIFKCRESVARAQIEWITLQWLCPIVAVVSLSAIHDDNVYVCMHARVLGPSFFVCVRVVFEFSDVISLLVYLSLRVARY